MPAGLLRTTASGSVALATTDPRSGAIRARRRFLRASMSGAAIGDILSSSTGFPLTEGDLLLRCRAGLDLLDSLRGMSLPLSSLRPFFLSLPLFPIGTAMVSSIEQASDTLIHNECSSTTRRKTALWSCSSESAPRKQMQNERSSTRRHWPAPWSCSRSERHQEQPDHNNKWLSK